MRRSNKVDVIVTCFNDEKSILEALKSVRVQDQGLIEHVYVIDNASTDRSWQRITEFCNSEKDFSCHIQAKPGAPAARNMGIEKSSAEFVAFLDGDDTFAANKIARQLAFMSSIQSQFSFTDVLMIGRSSPKVFRCPDLPHELDAQTRHLLRFSPAIFPSTMMLRREFLEKVGGFDEKFLKAQDTLFCLQASRHAPMDHLAEPLTVRKLREGSLGAGYGEKRRYLYRVISDFLDEYPQFNDVRSDAFYSIDMHFLRRAAGNIKENSWWSIISTISRHVHRRSMYPILIELLREPYRR